MSDKMPDEPITIRGCKTVDDIFDRSFPISETGCWIWLGTISTNGYATSRAHRISFELANGPIPEGMCICHRCDIRSCVNPAHLFAGSYADNYWDCAAKGRTNHPRGERHCQARLTAEQVDQVRASTLTQRELARFFGVNQSNISRIKRKERRANG